MTTMRRYRYVSMLGALLPLLTGCFLLSARPTEIPWSVTVAPGGTNVAEAAPSPTSTSEAATSPAAPSPATASPTAATAQATATAQAAATTQAATPSPTPAASDPTSTPGPAGQVITLELPVAGQSAGNPLRIRGRATQFPFEGTLVIRVYDAREQLAAQVPIIASGDYGGPATFETTITYGGVTGAGRIEVTELSPMDGSVVAQTSIPVTLTGFPGGGYVELPAPQSDVTLPIKLLARVGRPNQQVNVTVTWDEPLEGGESFSHVFTTLAGQDGRGLLIVPLDVIGPGFRHPTTQSGRIEVHTLEGSPLAVQPVRLLHPQDPDTVAVQVFWVRGETLAPQTLRIPRTQGIGRAALEALLWGPVPKNEAGYTTLLPTPDKILTYPGRDAHWGERIRIRSLEIRNGIAYADFSLELSAYSGGAMQSIMIREQIQATLRQFSTVNDVVITVNGISGVLEP